MHSSIVLAISALIAASAAELVPPPRHLQFFPQGNNQNAFRPSQGGPNGVQGQFGFSPQGNSFSPQGNGFNQGAFPVNGQMAGQQQNFGAGAGAGEADVTSAGDTAGSAGGAVTPGDIVPGQPTIMVILPDSIAAHSGWGSLTDDVGVTKTPTSEPPKPEETQKSGVNNSRGGAAMFAVAMTSIATALALN